jgi:hypothetical protein
LFSLEFRLPIAMWACWQHFIRTGPDYIRESPQPGNNQQRKNNNMKSKTIIAGAAVAGLMSGSFAVQAHAANVSTKAGVSLQQMGSKKASADKHSCKGENSCKGKGGCKTGDNGCKGKNSCKGKGGCATDGSKPAPSPS